MTNITVIREDITKMGIDAIVNAANPSLSGGAGVNGAIQLAAGPELLEACLKLGGCGVGEAKITAAYHLPAKYIIHTVGPVWEGGGDNEDKLLHNAYYNSLLLAKDHDIHTIAFPNISTGIYHYPKKPAAIIALTAVSSFCRQFPDVLSEVYFTCMDDENFKIYHTFLKG